MRSSPGLYECGMENHLVGEENCQGGVGNPQHGVENLHDGAENLHGGVENLHHGVENPHDGAENLHGGAKNLHGAAKTPQGRNGESPRWVGESIGRQCPQYGERGHSTAGSTQMTNEVLTHLYRRFKLEVDNRRWFDSSWIEQRVNRKWKKLYSTPSSMRVFIRLSCAQTM